MVRAKGDAGHAGLRLIAVFKFFKGSLLLLVAIGALRLVHHDVAQVAGRAAAELRMDPQNRFIRALLPKLTGVDDHVLRQMSAASFFYSALLLAEGFGLWLGKRWAEYMTIALTGSFLPVECYELARRLTLTRATVLVINLAIVAYLVWVVRTHREAARLDALPLEIDPAT